MINEKESLQFITVRLEADGQPCGTFHIVRCNTFSTSFCFGNSTDDTLIIFGIFYKMCKQRCHLIVRTKLSFTDCYRDHKLPFISISRHLRVDILIFLSLILMSTLHIIHLWSSSGISKPWLQSLKEKMKRRVLCIFPVVFSALTNWSNCLSYMKCTFCFALNSLKISKFVQIWQNKWLLYAAYPGVESRSGKSKVSELTNWAELGSKSKDLSLVVVMFPTKARQRERKRCFWDVPHITICVIYRSMHLKSSIWNVLYIKKSIALPQDETYLKAQLR